MSGTFRIEMLPAREGDCLLVEYGNANRVRRILVDGGRKGTYRAVRERFAALPNEERTFELLIVSHVDRDHIEGALALLDDATCPIRFKDIWFNGYAHLRDPEVETFGAVQGERLTTVLLERKLPWNEAFHRRSVEVRNGSERVRLDGGMTLTLVSPDRARLEALLPRWKTECRRAGLIPGARARRERPDGLERMGRIDIDALDHEPFEADRTEPNGSSIAVLAEYTNRRALLAADAHADQLVEALRPRAVTEGGRLSLDAFKLSHHASKHNVSHELLELIACSHYLISTNGAYYQHPDPTAIARVVKHGGHQPELVFNYRSSQSQIWDNRRWQVRHEYRTRYPTAGENGQIAIEMDIPEA